MSLLTYARKKYYYFRGLRQQKGLKRKKKYTHFFRLADKNGVIPFRIERIAAEYVDDYFADTGLPSNEKEWFYKRGIPTFKTGWYGLTKENYNDYISDFDFYSKKNYTEYSGWFDNKLTTYLILHSFAKNMPRHLFYIRKGKIHPLDVDIDRECNADDILSLCAEAPICFKRCTGGHGRGFYVLSRDENGYLIDFEKASEDSIRSLVAGLDDYIVTEYCKPSKIFSDYCGEGNFAVIRTVTVFDREDGPQITAILIRLGTKSAGLVSDYDGCINCGVDLKSGRLFEPIMRTGDSEGIIRRVDAKIHPDTGRDLEEIVVPDFEKLTELAKNVSSFLSMTPYLVMDIIPTDDGFKILEINSHGQVRNLEPFFPFRKNKYNLRVFETKDR